MFRILADNIGTDGRNTIIPDLAFFLQFFESFYDFINRIFQGTTMQLVEINMIRLKSPEALIDCFKYIFFCWIPIPPGAVRTPLVSHFGCEYHLFPLSPERPSQQRFNSALLIQIGCIEIVDALPQGFLDKTL